MARPPKTDRAAVNSDTLTLRLTPDDRVTLDALVAAKAAELEQDGLEMTAAAYVRGLIRREGRRLFGDTACSCTITKHERQENRACPVHFPKVALVAVPSVAAPPVETKAVPVERRSKPRADDKQVRSLFDRALSKGIKQATISSASGVSQSFLSRWKSGQYGLTDDKLEALSGALASLLQPSLPSVSR